MLLHSMICQCHEEHRIMKREKEEIVNPIIKLSIFDFISLLTKHIRHEFVTILVFLSNHPFLRLLEGLETTQEVFDVL